MNTRQTTRNSRLTPANMRRVGGGYVPIQEQPHQRTRAATPATTKTELQRLREENESLRREIGHLRASKAQTESAFTRQNDALVELSKMNEAQTVRLEQHEAEAAAQKKCIEKLAVQLKTTVAELEARTVSLKQVQTEHQHAVRLLGEYRQQLKQVSTSSLMATKGPDTEIDGDSSPNFYKKLNRALRLENDELHHKVEELRKTIEHLQRQIKQLLKSSQQTINVGSRNS
ncbi:unnamed protein product [Albugo candida]|uniref:Uncharacterized protein n=1 Tax=Albugo candida TaxID=65357 RepID=A0A024GFX6_9STRA|nr:unnamed protein product [Albugo candida]|eukprot:CCI45668.1 unnamed protein product [Albugo candida]